MRNVGSSELKNIKLAGQRKSYRLSHSNSLKMKGIYFCQLIKCIFVKCIKYVYI